MQGRGFEPLKAEPAGLQPAPFGHSGTPARAGHCSRTPHGRGAAGRRPKSTLGARFSARPPSAKSRLRGKPWGAGRRQNRIDARAAPASCRRHPAVHVPRDRRPRGRRRGVVAGARQRARAWPGSDRRRGGGPGRHGPAATTARAWRAAPGSREPRAAPAERAASAGGRDPAAAQHAGGCEPARSLHARGACACSCASASGSGARAIRAGAVSGACARFRFGARARAGSARAGACYGSCSCSCSRAGAGCSDGKAQAASLAPRAPAASRAPRPPRPPGASGASRAPAVAAARGGSGGAGEREPGARSEGRWACSRRRRPSRSGNSGNPGCRDAGGGR